jgi:PTH1 family peptidyl-tRNA hydrolase
MNESGRSVGAAASFFKVDPDAVLVVHDESDLELGRLQLRLGGGLAGHNGLRSIAQHLKTQEFLRLRVGVGRPERGDPRPLADWVLANFEPHDDAEALVGRAADAVETLDAAGVERAQVQVNRR